MDFKTPLTPWPQTPIEAGNPIATGDRLTRVEGETVQLRDRVDKLEKALEKSNDTYQRDIRILIGLLFGSVGWLFSLLLSA